MVVSPTQLAAAEAAAAVAKVTAAATEALE